MILVIEKIGLLLLSHLTLLITHNSLDFTHSYYHYLCCPISHRHCLPDLHFTVIYSGQWIATVPLPSLSYNVKKYTNVHVHVIMKLYSEALLKLKTLFDQAHHARLYSRTLVT